MNRSDLEYWGWVKNEAAKIKADGCSRVTQARQECCFEHDLSYYYGRDPRDAYRLYKEKCVDCWAQARHISKFETEERFWDCNAQRSRVRWFSPMAGWRYLGVSLFAWKAWLNHRKLRP